MGRGLIDFAPEETSLAIETYETWVRMFELQRYSASGLLVGSSCDRACRVAMFVRTQAYSAFEEHERSA
ncbi:hypothetical protein ACWGE0_22740 [Lentzea sp. NPDC054927]